MSLEFSRYDRRGYRTVDVREGYRRWSATYDAQMSGDIDIALLERLAGVDWRVDRAIDLACGTGRIGSWLADRGARRIDGVDVSDDMLGAARARGVYTDLVVADIRNTGLPGGVADLVTCVLAIEHLPELAAFYAELARLVRPGGLAIVIGYHPHFLLNGIPTHFRIGAGDEAEDNLAIENTIHLASDHVRAAHAQGFVLRAMDERVVDDDMVARLPTWCRHAGHPASHLLAWGALHRGEGKASLSP